MLSVTQLSCKNISSDSWTNVLIKLFILLVSYPLQAINRTFTNDVNHYANYLSLKPKTADIYGCFLEK